MASTSHRKCQYQGEGCMGTAHAGHDQCAHCYFQYIKPALQVERQAVKRRRELKKRGRADAGGVLDNNVRQEGGTLGYLDLDDSLKTPKPPRPISIHRAIAEVEIDHLLGDKTVAEAVDVLAEEMLKDELRNVPVLMPRPVVKSAPEEEPPVQNIGPEPVFTKHYHAGGDGSRLTVEQVAEVLDAYRDDSLPVKDICNGLNIATTTLYAILRESKLPFRSDIARPKPRRPFDFGDQLDAVLAPPKEPDMPQSTPPVSPPKVEPASPNGVVSGLTEWTVTYTVRKTETKVVAAKSFNDAAAAVGNMDPDIDVVSVAKVAKS